MLQNFTRMRRCCQDGGVPVALKLRNGVVAGDNEGTAEFFDCQALVVTVACALKEHSHLRVGRPKVGPATRLSQIRDDGHRFAQCEAIVVDCRNLHVVSSVVLSRTSYSTHSCEVGEIPDHKGSSPKTLRCAYLSSPPCRA